MSTEQCAMFAAYTLPVLNYTPTVLQERVQNVVAPMRLAVFHQVYEIFVCDYRMAALLCVEYCTDARELLPDYRCSNRYARFL